MDGGREGNEGGRECVSIAVVKALRQRGCGLANYSC